MFLVSGPGSVLSPPVSCAIAEQNHCVLDEEPLRQVRNEGGDRLPL